MAQSRTKRIKLKDQLHAEPGKYMSRFLRKNVGGRGLIRGTYLWTIEPLDIPEGPGNTLSSPSSIHYGQQRGLACSKSTHDTATQIPYYLYCVASLITCPLWPQLVLCNKNATIFHHSEKNTEISWQSLALPMITANFQVIVEIESCKSLEQLSSESEGAKDFSWTGIWRSL